jgi:sigma-E factor negative regulatory protein RseC
VQQAAGLYKKAGTDFLKLCMVEFSMIEEIGIVTSINGVTAQVSIPRKSTCEGCTAGTCIAGEQSMEIAAVNKAGARVGQKVKVLVRSYVYMKSSMIIYGIPAVALITGAVIGKEVMAKFFTGTDPDILSAIFGFGFLILSFIAVKIWSNLNTDSTESSPVIEEILD